MNRRSSGRITALLWAAACTAATIWIAVGAFEIEAVQTADRRTLVGFTTFAAGPVVKSWATTLSHLTGPSQAIVLGAAIIAVVAWRSGARLAALFGTILLGANLTAQLLQRTVDVARYPAYLSDSIFPSGHTTAAISLAICLVLLAPPALRLLAAVVAGVAVTAIAFSILHLGQHHPSDVLSALWLTGAWTGIAVAAFGSGDATVPRRPAALRAVLGATAGAAALSALIAGTTHLRAVPTSAADRATFVVGAAVISASALIVATVPALVSLRRAST